MPNFCAVVGCSNRSGRGDKKSFYRIPSIVSHQGERTRLLTVKRRAEWVKALRRKNLKLKNNHHYQYENHHICSDHFIKGVPATLYDVSNPDWTPSVNMGHQYFTSDGQAGCGQPKRRSKKLGHRSFKDRVQISCDRTAQTAGGYEKADCLHFDQASHLLNQTKEKRCSSPTPGEDVERFVVKRDGGRFALVKEAAVSELC